MLMNSPRRALPPSGSALPLMARTAWPWQLLNILAFQTCWWALILTTDELPWIGFLLLGCWAAVHLSFSTARSADLRLMGLLVLFGPMVDALIAICGLLVYHGPTPLPGAPPLWIFGLWLGFALTVNHSMAGILDKPRLAALLGTIGGPLSYLAGVRLGAAELGRPLWEVAIGVGMFWGAALYCLSMLRRTTPALAPRVSEFL